MRDPATGKVYIVAESRLSEIPGAVPKKGKGKKGEEAKGFEVGPHPARAGARSGGGRAADHAGDLLLQQLLGAPGWCKLPWPRAAPIPSPGSRCLPR